MRLSLDLLPLVLLIELPFYALWVEAGYFKVFLYLAAIFLVRQGILISKTVTKFVLYCALYIDMHACMFNGADLKFRCISFQKA